MGPNDENNYVMTLDGQPIEFAEFTADTTTESETQLECKTGIERGKAIAEGIIAGLKSVELSFEFEYKTPKRCRCTTRKRYIKLRMADGISRNGAEAEAQLLIGIMGYSCQEAYNMAPLSYAKGRLLIY